MPIKITEIGWNKPPDVSGWLIDSLLLLAGL